MRFPLVRDDSQPLVSGRSLASCGSIWLAVLLFLLAQSGCKTKAKPGVTYDVSIIALGNDGRATPQGEPMHVEAVQVENVQEVNHDGQTLSLKIRKTQYGRATFDVIFPNKATQMVQVKAGEAKDILPFDQKIGVRIELQESH